MEGFRRVKIYTWEYDDSAWGYVVRQQKKWLDKMEYTTKREVKKICKKYETDDSSTQKKKVFCSGGLNCVKYRYADMETENQGTNGFEAMFALINSCGSTPDAKREMLRLVASVLAGYCARVSSGSYMHFLSQLQRRAPIIIVKQSPFAGEALERVIRSLALDTTETTALRHLSSGRTIECVYSPVLPKKAGDEKITDRAFLKLEGCKKRMLPQYRDTTLMIYDWLLRGKDGRRLQLMNRWVSIVIYGASRKQFVTTPVEIDGGDLARSDCQWDKNDVQLSVIRFARYVYRESLREKWKKKIEFEFSRYDAMINSHNQNCSTKIKAAERYQLSMQLLALHLFLKACVKEQDVNQSQAIKIENEWYTVLLPGCETLSDSDFMEHGEADTETENGWREEFEGTLIKIFDKGFPDRFYISKEDDKTDMWGDIGPAPSKNQVGVVYSVRFSQKKFVSLLDEFGVTGGGEWFYEKVKALDLDYMEFRDKMRIKATKTNTKGVFFEINKMAFLPQELCSKLNGAGQRAERDRNGKKRKS